MNAYLDHILEDTLAEIGGEVRTEQYWTDPGLHRWFAEHAEACRLSEIAMSAWLCQRGKKELNDKRPPNWSMNL